jgi:hypothetical protein
MGKSAKRLDLILGKITDELNSAFLYFFIARSIQEHFLCSENELAPHFFTGTYHACLRECLLSISKMVIEDPESITFKYLLDHVENHPKNFPGSSQDEIQTIVDEHRRFLRAFSPLSETIRVIRDRELAHFDRKHINEPDSMLLDSIKFNEIADFLNVLSEITTKYQTLRGISASDLSQLRETIEREVEVLKEKIGEGVEV